MDGSGETESGLKFETPKSPANVHENWFMKKLHDMEMASEMRIKGETMGASNREVITGAALNLLNTAIIGEAANFGTDSQGTVMISQGLLMLASEIVTEIADKLEKR